jgi:hypothetical protein
MRGFFASLRMTDFFGDSGAACELMPRPRFCGWELFCGTGVGCDQCGKDDACHDLVGGRAVGVVVAGGEDGDEIILRKDVDLLASVALRGAHGYALWAAGGGYVEVWTPPEVAVVGVVDLALCGERCLCP